MTSTCRRECLAGDASPEVDVELDSTEDVEIAENADFGIAAGGDLTLEISGDGEVTVASSTGNDPDLSGIDSYDVGADATLVKDEAISGSDAIDRSLVEGDGTLVRTGFEVGDDWMPVTRMWRCRCSSSAMTTSKAPARRGGSRSASARPARSSRMAAGRSDGCAGPQRHPRRAGCRERERFRRLRHRQRGPSPDPRRRLRISSTTRRMS